MNANLSYMLSRVSSVSTQIFRLDPQNSTSSSPGQTIRVSLPSNTLLNLKSIKMLANVTLGGSGARLPPKINSLIDRVTLECGGVTIKSQDVDLCEGMPLIAHRRWEEKDLKNSARGTIVSVKFNHHGEDELVIALDRTGALVEMATSDFHRYWRPAFCITVHQSQCITINQPYTIYGWNHEHMLGPEGPRGRYVAVSRGTKMEHVQICLEKGYDR